MFEAIIEILEIETIDEIMKNKSIIIKEIPNRFPIFMFFSIIKTHLPILFTCKPYHKAKFLLKKKIFLHVLEIFLLYFLNYLLAI